MTQLEATEVLRKYALDHGRYWKADLRDSWMNGVYLNSDASAELQTIRNSLGPTWLSKFSLNKPPKEPLGVCAECRDDITSMRGVLTAKDGALFHGRCWSNA